MDQFGWVFWAGLGILLIIAEIFTLGFVLFWFGIGALVAALAGYLGVGFFGQFLVFAFTSVILTFMSRTIFEQYFPGHRSEHLKSGYENLPGTIGTVVVGSKGALNEGVIKAFGSRWNALPEHSDEQLVEGEKVEIVRLEGSSVYVRKVGKESPGWKD